MQGYLQIPLDEQSRHKTAFITPDENGEFNTAMFELMNAPFYFMKAMHRALEPLHEQVVLYFFDDILIPGNSWPELKEKLRETLTAPRRAGFTLNLRKCQFLESLVPYLGFEISGNAIKPGEQKLRAISEFAPSKNALEIRRFLGLMSFFRRFVPGYAARADPLYRLLRNGEPFKCDEKQRDRLRTFATL